MTRAAPVIDDEVSNDGEQPCPGGFIALFENGGFLPGTKKCLLHHILGKAVIPGEAKRKAQQSGSMGVMNRPQQFGLVRWHCNHLHPYNELCMHSVQSSCSRPRSV